MKAEVEVPKSVFDSILRSKSLDAKQGTAF